MLWQIVIDSTKLLFQVLFYYILHYMLVIRGWSSKGRHHEQWRCVPAVLQNAFCGTPTSNNCPAKQLLQALKARHFVPKRSKQLYAIGSTAQRNVRYSAAAGQANATMPELRCGRASSSSVASIALQYRPS